MRLIAHIKKNDLLIARASVDDADGEHPAETAAKGMEQMLRDMRRNNGDMSRGDGEQAARDLADFEALNEAYGQAIETALIDRADAVSTGMARDGVATMHTGMIAFAPGATIGMTIHFEAKSDASVAETEAFVDRMLQRA